MKMLSGAAIAVVLCDLMVRAASQGRGIGFLGAGRPRAKARFSDKGEGEDKQYREIDFG
ncbi:hypothetical protein [Ovoidimarina sediminis]|uniref:hypothetical protein n=1 Tax=Ovoidimarina sediminis TaxID=3079856 RepID=UPI002910127D|nr:hypothetical protein [Rhodophyticola sp. MJ-SS7]MDU8942462.1 hypothetical protein [Rhodophyticola sp. MJ-SS7]